MVAPYVHHEQTVAAGLSEAGRTIRIVGKRLFAKDRHVPMENRFDYVGVGCDRCSNDNPVYRRQGRRVDNGLLRKRIGSITVYWIGIDDNHPATKFHEITQDVEAPAAAADQANCDWISGGVLVTRRCSCCQGWLHDADSSPFS